MPSLALPGVLLCFDEERVVAQACADLTGLTLSVVERHRFPDGEVRVRLPEALPPRVVVWRGLHQPNEKLVELMLVARTQAPYTTHEAEMSEHRVDLRNDAIVHGRPHTTPAS